MARLVYEITGDITGLQSAINQASNLITSASGKSSQINITVPDISPQVRAGISALDTLDKKLAVIAGNATLFGDSLKLQSQEVSAYQGAINSLLANGFDPMDGDIQRLKQRLDEFTSSLRNVKNVEAEVATNTKETFEEVQAFLNASRNAQSQTTPAAVINAPTIGGLGQSSALTSLNQQLLAGTLSVQEYNAALIEANLSEHLISEGAIGAAGAIEAEVGVIQGLKEQLASLNAQRITAPQESLAALNAEIQQVELSLSQATNVGKVGFDQMGNSIKGVSVQNINGQLVSLSNNLFGARQISRDLVRTFDATSVGTFARSISLLAVDFLFFAQNAQFARTSTIGATAAIAVEGEVATGAALSTGALGAAFASLLTPTSLIVLGIAAAGAAFIAFESSQKKALDTTKDFTKEIAKDAGTELGPLVSMYGATQNLTHSIQDRLAAAQQLRETYPEEFANATNLAIINGQLKGSYDELTKSIIENAKAEAAKTEIQKAESEIIKNQLIVDQNNLNKANQIRAVKPLTQDQISAQNRSGGGAVTIADQIKAITDQTNFANEGPINKIKELNGTVQQLIGFVTNVNKAATDLQKANALLGPNLKNFNNLLNLGSSKQDFENIKKALETELDALAPSDPQIANLRAKILQVEQIIKDAYTVKLTKGTTTDPFQTIGDAITRIINEINAKSSESGLSGYQLQVQKINDTYIKINTELDKQQQKLNALNATNLSPKKQAEKDTDQTQLDTARNLSSIAQAKELSDAKIKEAERVSNEIIRINDEFGVKQTAGYNSELASIQKLYDKEVEKAKGNVEILNALNADRIKAIQAVDEKYIQLEVQAYGKIIDIANQAFEALDSGEASRTDKINLEWQKRATAANVYFDKLRDLAKAANLPQSSTDNINSVQAQVNVLLKAANANQISVEVSKPFANALQNATDNFITGFYSDLVNLGQARQAIDNKYISQLSSATSQSAIDQINNLKKIEQQATTSFGAVFSSLVSKFSSTFNTSILSSFSKLLTENLGKALIAPTQKQLSISPEERAAQNVSTTLKSAGADLAEQIKSAGVDFANSVRLSKGLLSGASGGSAVSDAAGFALSQVPGAGVVAGANFNASVTNAGNTLSAGLVAAGATASGAIVAGATTAATETKAAAGQLSAKIGGLAAAASLVGGIISGVTSPTSSVGQGVGGALQGAGEGALIGSVIPGLGTVAGAVIGGVIGGISGLLSASKAKKQEELQQKQLEQQQQTNVLLARQNALAYTSSIIGRMSNQGVITGVDLNAFGQLTAVVSGKTIQFVLDRNSNGR